MQAVCGPFYGLPQEGCRVLPDVRHQGACLFWIYPLIHRGLLQKRKSAARDAYRLTLRCLASFEDANAQDLASVKGVAAAAVSEFIRSPDIFQFDVLESPAVAQLKGDAQYGKLWQLLQIALDGDLKVTGLQLPALKCRDRHHVHKGSWNRERPQGGMRSLLWDIWRAVL